MRSTTAGPGPSFHEQFLYTPPDLQGCNERGLRASDALVRVLLQRTASLCAACPGLSLTGVGHGRRGVQGNVECVREHACVSVNVRVSKSQTMCVCWCLRRARVCCV